MKGGSVAMLGLAVALLSVPAAGHHSHAMYDTAHPVVIKGTVKGFEWTNPHAWLYVTAMDETGQAVEWSLEMGSTASIAQEGWRPRSVAPGDVVSVAIHLVKADLRSLTEGRNVGALVAIALPNGTHIGGEAYFK